MKKRDRLQRYYRLMLTIRYFEERIEQLFAKGLIKGTAHPAIGQEAIAVGACSVLQKKDYITSTHRGHGHFIARGGDPSRMMAELYGKATGYSGGRGGSQLMTDFSMGFLGSNGITGGGIPIATGAALSAQLRNEKHVALCFFGDGAANQGTFHESLNLAAIWNLPVVYLCENNGYAMSMPVANSVGVQHIADRAIGYGFPGVAVNGNDLDAVRAEVGRAVTRARQQGGPTLIECKTYRMSGHSRGDQRQYRTREEEAMWRKADPILLYRKQLVKEGYLTSQEDKDVKRAARAAISDAVKFAKSSPDPDPDTLLDGLYA